MSLSEAQKNEVKQIFDEQLARFLKYGLKALEAPDTAKAPTPTTNDAAKYRSIEDVKMIFPEELEVKLTFEDKGDYIQIKPKTFLGTDNFKQVADIAKGSGGGYVSAGKESHFCVPKKKVS